MFQIVYPDVVKTFCSIELPVMSRIPILINCLAFTKSTELTTGSMCTDSQRPGDNFTNIFISDFIVHKFFAQLFSTYSLAMYFLAEEYWLKNC